MASSCLVQDPGGRVGCKCCESSFPHTGAFAATEVLSGRRRSPVLKGAPEALVPVKLLKGHRSLPARHTFQVTATQQVCAPGGRGLSAGLPPSAGTRSPSPLALATFAPDTTATRPRCSPAPRHVSSTRALRRHKNAGLWEGAGFLCCPAVPMSAASPAAEPRALGGASRPGPRAVCAGLRTGAWLAGADAKAVAQVCPHPRADQPGCDSSACLGRPGWRRGQGADLKHKDGKGRNET